MLRGEPLFVLWEEQAGSLTYGESIEEALANAREALTGYVESLVAGGGPVPAESQPTIATTLVTTSDEAA